MKHRKSLLAAALCCIPLAVANERASAQSTQTLSEVVVTADRTPSPLERTGSAISVVDGATLATTNSASLVDALRSVPGIDVSETGGPGGTTSVRLRGANTGQTLVLIDGVRANDPSNASGDFDFSMFAPGSIERIEVLRGPQSALYGSDAIGGVVNIITRKGSGPARASATIEGGSYGTASGMGAISGSQGPWSYAVNGALQRSDGFSRYGYRIPSIEARFPNLERDGYGRIAGSARVGYDAGEGVRFDAGILSSYLKSDYDAATGAFPDTPSVSTRWFSQANARTAFDTFDGRWTHSLNVFANRNERSFDETTYRINMLPANTTRIISDFTGDRVGAEYQATLRMDQFGSLVYGAKAEHETAATFATNRSPVPGPRNATLDAKQDTRSLFALWQVPIGERLNVTAGGRVDDVANVARFATWRTTAAYAIHETGTKLRASAGTGAKAPTLFQLYAPIYGNPNLNPEESFGYDAGIDQSLFGGRLNVSLTGFANSFRDLIEFDTATSRYFNVARAETSGLEVAADVEIIPAYVHFKAAYTNLRAKDLRTNRTLARRPEHTARFAVSFTPTPNWLIEPRVVVVSDRFSNANEAGLLAAYARVDLYVDYRLESGWKVFARGENILNKRYQEVLNYGTTGPAVYAGVSGSW
ncbi:TonB-denpendent receptor [Afipia sp. P52-10]|uniref:TonB-dependent receptor plug domain-containing protein n=1 Tax=Afipia sp. P52-10 TaxID=1429916 RepID=UPI0003DEF7B1|nr:TonB-dependent receptor [Afipia sp. P52-10]ETR76268.1 TonB-denpendent receptor [Afipia sp. P52-10]